MISIHALRVEGDKLFLRRHSRGAHFYPRPPGGGRPHHISYRVSNAFNFYPRPPGGGRLRFVCNVDFFSTISIHALRVEGDTPSLVSIKIFKGFLSTPSGWRATKTCHICIRIDQISIHALRVEGDLLRRRLRLKIVDFYPRPPGGGRHRDQGSNPRDSEFLSTPSGWRATVDACRCIQNRLQFLSTPSGWRATK